MTRSRASKTANVVAKESLMLNLKNKGIEHTLISKALFRILEDMATPREWKAARCACTVCLYYGTSRIRFQPRVKYSNQYALKFLLLLARLAGLGSGAFSRAKARTIVADLPDRCCIHSAAPRV
jgi:hypothetical protein